MSKPALECNCGNSVGNVAGMQGVTELGEGP